MDHDGGVEVSFENISPQLKRDGPEAEVQVADNPGVSDRSRSRTKKSTITSTLPHDGSIPGSERDRSRSGVNSSRSRSLKVSIMDGANNNSFPKQSKTSTEHSKTSLGGRSIGKLNETAGALVGGSIVIPYSPSKSIRISSSRPLLKLSNVNPNHYNLVDKAIKEHKVFCIGGVYPAIRTALRKRGWVEKIVNASVPQYMRSIVGPHLNRDVDTKPTPDDDTENAFTQRVLSNYPPDFIWVIRRDNIPWQQIARDQIINRFPRAFFTTKVGIAACLQGIHWFSEPGVSDTFFPRCYRISLEEERQAFLDDYRLSACVAMLRWFTSTFEKLGERAVYDPSSKISCLAIDFAVRQMNNYVRMRRHEDIDWLMPPAFLSQHWEIFLTQYYSVVHQKYKLSPADSTDSAKMKYDMAKKSIQRLAPYWSQMTADGIMNIWICKPGARSRGKGIVLMNQLDRILNLLSQSASREANWVVQKYIEKPMLIYKTKFDMRQWFIVTDWAPLTVWFAKESYVRFCTKPFSLSDFHESVHLCNNAVQCKYQNATNRDPGLPDENMWDCYTFQAYLKTIGKLELWEKVIYPGMKQGILGVLLASQESTDVKKNCFELYGADYMFTEDFRPWLIEINSCPCMAGSTSVTARMCAQCLEDTIKVVIDRKLDRNADTGMFELIYRQNPATLNVTQFNSNELAIQGKKMSKDVDWPGIMTKYNARRGVSPRVTQPVVKVTPDVGLTFTDLVQKLRLKETSKILSLSPFETVQKALQQTLSSTSPGQRSTPSINQSRVLSIKSFPETPSTIKPKTFDSGNILNVRKLPAPDNVGVNSNTRLSEVVRTVLNNSPIFTKPLSVGAKRVEINGGKAGTIPLSYLMYNAKSNPITITDMIREYSESSAKVKTIEALAKKVIESERRPRKRTSLDKRKIEGKSKSPYNPKATVSFVTQKSGMPLNLKISKVSTSSRNHQNLNKVQNLKDAVEQSRQFKQQNGASQVKTTPKKN